MLRLWTWWVIVWRSDDGWYDQLARRAPVRAALVVGLVFGVIVWLLVSAMLASVAPFDAFVSPFVVFSCTFGPVAVWLRRGER